MTKDTKKLMRLHRLIEDCQEGCVLCGHAISHDDVKFIQVIVVNGQETGSSQKLRGIKQATQKSEEPRPKKPKSHGSRQRIYNRHRRRCFFCNKIIQKREPFQIHHITPTSEGGKDIFTNKAPAHIECHRQFHQPA